MSQVETIGPRSWLDRWLSSHPGKAAVERFWLMYTPVWAGCTGLVMIGGFAERWGDVTCMLYGVVMALGAWWVPLRVRGPGEADLPLYETAAFKAATSVTVLAFGLNYTQTPYFFDVLHMHYGWQTTWNIDRNPIWLYFMSVPYFGLYFTLCTVSFRWLQTSASALLRGLAWIVAPMAVAFLETAMNANPFMTTLFCYDDMVLMGWFGTFSYGVAFTFVLPIWMSIDENHERSLPWLWVVVGTLGAMYADLIVLDILRYHVAPHFTTVVENAPGLRDFGNGCLVAP